MRGTHWYSKLIWQRTSIGFHVLVCCSQIDLDYGGLVFVEYEDPKTKKYGDEKWKKFKLNLKPRSRGQTWLQRSLTNATSLRAVLLPHIPPLYPLPYMPALVFSPLFALPLYPLPYMPSIVSLPLYLLPYMPSLVSPPLYVLPQVPPLVSSLLYALYHVPSLVSPPLSPLAFLPSLISPPLYPLAFVPSPISLPLYASHYISSPMANPLYSLSDISSYPQPPPPQPHYLTGSQWQIKKTRNGCHPSSMSLNSWFKLLKKETT